VSILKILSQYGQSIAEINLSDVDKKPGHARGEGIKMIIPSIYDVTTLDIRKGEMWNWGMHDEAVVQEIDLRIPNFARFDTDGFSEQLYFLALHQIPLDLNAYENRVILEVGCGLGEGLNFLSRLVEASSMIGLDLSGTAIERAEARLSRGNRLRFIQGDAEKLPFADNALDVVLNIESSHNYPDLGQFFREAARVLKPGGFLSHMDLFTRQRYELMDRLKHESTGLRWIHERDISREVRASISRRTTPGSFFRQVHAKSGAPRMWFLRRIEERIQMVLYGAVFAGYQDDALLNLLRKAGAFRPLPVESYWHHLATKA
jgi:ubiquinone/menaquinone biosynthesis C-methylase UbiE